MRTYTITNDITMTLTNNNTISKYENYLETERVYEDARKNFHQAIEDVFNGNGEGYDRSDLYDWEDASNDAGYTCWEAWERFCA